MRGRQHRLLERATPRRTSCAGRWRLTSGPELDARGSSSFPIWRCSEALTPAGGPDPASHPPFSRKITNRTCNGHATTPVLTRSCVACIMVPPPWGEGDDYLPKYVAEALLRRLLRSCVLGRDPSVAEAAGEKRNAKPIALVATSPRWVITL